jgi:hypothetical protein
MSCHVNELGHPSRVNPEKFHLITPYETNPRKWLKKEWIDEYSGEKYGITVVGDHGTRYLARVKTYGETVQQYEFHPEAKCADSRGQVCGKQTIGLLHRRHIRIEKLKFIGKESNKLEEVELGVTHDAQNVYTEYPDPTRDEWTTGIVPILKTIPLKQLHEETGISTRELKYIRAGYHRPHPRNARALEAKPGQN